MIRLLPPALAAAVLLVPPPAVAQPLQSFLALPIKTGHTLVVTETSGAQIVGKLATVTANEIALNTRAGTRRFGLADVRQLAVRKRHRLLGTIVGGGIGGVLGLTVDCGGPENPCDPDIPILLGAVTGLVVGALWQSTVVLYTAPTGGAATVAPPAAAASAWSQSPRLPW